MPAFTVQINCGSGMQSIDTAFRTIENGGAEIVLAGGAEALSTFAARPAPRGGRLVRRKLNGARSTGDKLKALLGPASRLSLKPVIGLERGLTDPITELNMGQTAEILAHRFDISSREPPTPTPPRATTASTARRIRRLAEANEMLTAFSRDGDGLRP